MTLQRNVKQTWQSVYLHTLQKRMEEDRYREREGDRNMGGMMQRDAAKPWKCARIKTTNPASKPFLFSTPNNSWKCKIQLLCMPQRLQLGLYCLFPSLCLPPILGGFTKSILTEYHFLLKLTQQICQEVLFCLSTFWRSQKRKKKQSGKRLVWKKKQQCCVWDQKNQDSTGKSRFSLRSWLRHASSLCI